MRPKTDQEFLGMLGALMLAIGATMGMFLIFGSAWYVYVSFYGFFYVFAKFWWKYLA